MAPDPGKLVELNVKPRPKVIVADDEQEIATLIEEWLSEGYEVTVALNGKAAIQKAVWQKPAVILCDIVMPDMGGYEVARALQGNAATQDIPMIVMTAKIYDDSTVKLIKAEPNVRGFIVKPFKPSELIKMVEAVIGGQRTFVPLPPSAGPAPVLAVRPAPSPAAAAQPGAPEFVSPPRAAPPPAPPPPTQDDSRLAQRAVDRSEATQIIPPPLPPAAVSAPPRAADFPQPVPPRSSPAPIHEEGEKRHSAASRAARFAAGLAVKGVVLAALLFGAGELASRWASQISGEPFMPPLRPARKAALPYQFEPGGQWRVGRVDYRINAWGLRGGDFPLLAPPGVTRVLVLGGSAVFGPDVEESALLAERLGDRLGASVQVINAGFWGYSPEEQWNYYEDEGFQFRPQVVVWLLEPRDPEGLTGEGLRRMARMDAGAALARRSQFARLAALVWSRSGPDDPPTDADKLIERARAFTKSHDNRLLVWTAPASGAGRGPGRGPWPVKSVAEGFGALMADRVLEAVQPVLAESPGQN